MKKYGKDPPQIYVFDKIPKEIDNFVVSGMELFANLTQPTSTSQRSKEVKLLARVFASENASGRYQSIFKKGKTGKKILLDISYTPHYALTEKLMDKTFYKSLRTRVDHMQSSNLNQAYQHLKKLINDYVKDSQQKLEIYASSKKKTTINSSLSRINAYTKPFLQDLKVLENRFTLVSKRKYEQKLWDNFIESKGKEVNEYV